MSALQKTGRPTFTRARENKEIQVIEPSKLLFRVVVNNFKEKEERSLDKTEETGETIMDDHQGLPPQPKEYMKFPAYDPF